MQAAPAALVGGLSGLPASAAGAIPLQTIGLDTLCDAGIVQRSSNTGLDGFFLAKEEDGAFGLSGVQITVQESGVAWLSISIRAKLPQREGKSSVVR